ncbi:unnamed protein product [Heterobilharzia americana]|nr:unnamed protein product [Heterobilharzia americana]
MTEVNENSDSAINSASIQLNEDDWLQLLQKLTPSSIESLQQTLKRLQTPEHITTDKPNSSMSLISRSPAIIPSQPVVSQAHPIVMSLGMTKAPITPVMAMPHVLNISKNTGNPVPGRIVLPSSALLITPPSHGQTYSLDSCVPVADLSRLVVTTGCLPNTTTGLITTTTIPETFSSLNTLANAAVAMAANASHWSTSVSVPSTTTVQTGNSFRFSPNPFTSTATGTTISSSSSMTGLIHSSSNSTIDLNTPILSGLGSTSLTVYPVHVSANGSTVLVAASPSTTTIPTIQDTSKSCFANNPTVSIYSSSSFGNCLNSVGEITTLSPLSVTCNSNLSINSVTSPTPVHTSTPRGKPKFKALWESTLSNNDRSSRSSTTVTSASGDSGIESLINFEQTTHRSLEESATTTTAQTSSTLSTNSLSKISRSNKRQSPMLGLKSIGQTPKRLAATAASSLTQDNKSNSSDGCRKKFLLICSPPKSVHTKSQMESDSSLCLSGGNNLPESVLLSTNTSTSSIELDTHNPTTGQLMTPASDDCMPTLVVKASERNATTTSTSATTTSITTNDNNNNNNPLKQTNLLHFTGSNVSSSRESSDIADSDPIGCEVLIGKTFESGRRSLKEEPVSDDEARRRAKRRERNRVAAAKCRQRRQDQIEELQQRVDALTRTGQELRSSLHSLDLERTRLETLIEEHKIFRYSFLKNPKLK